MKNKELILEAINEGVGYTATQKAILTYLLAIEIEGIANSSPKDLLEKIGGSSQTICYSLNKLENNNLIKRLTPKRAHFCKFEFNQDGLTDFISGFLKRKNYKNLNRIKQFHLTGLK